MEANTKRIISATKAAGQVAASLVLALSVTACALTGSGPRSVPVADEDQSGFTIAETQRVAHHLRGDYEAAMAALARGDHSAGIALLEALVAKAPQLSVPRIDLGIAHHAAGNLEAAELQLSQALQTSPDHPVALNELGIVYRKTGRFQQARQSYEAALAAFPSYHFARRNLAILCELYLEDLPCALENYEAYAAVSPGDSDAAMWIATLRLRMDQVAQ